MCSNQFQRIKKKNNEKNKWKKMKQIAKMEVEKVFFHGGPEKHIGRWLYEKTIWP